VSIIGEDAFRGCDNLKEVTCKAVIPPREILIFKKETEENFPIFLVKERLYVPKASLEAYREDEEWGRFKQILPIEE